MQATMTAPPQYTTTAMAHGDAAAAAAAAGMASAG